MHPLILADPRTRAIMAYHYRGPQPPPDESQFSNFSGNPLSPPRNPNRLSAGMMGSSNNNDARGSLMRRFTTNALPTLSPIGQQRRQAAGDPQMVSTISPLQLDGGQQVSVKNETTGVQANGNGYGYTFTALGGLLIDSEPPPGMSKFPNIDSVYNSTGFGILHRRGKSCWRAIGDGRSRLSDEDEYTRTENEGGSLLFSTNDVHVYLLTHQDKPTGAYSRVPPVSLLSFFSVHVAGPSWTHKHAILGTSLASKASQRPASARACCRLL